MIFDKEFENLASSRFFVRAYLFPEVVPTRQEDAEKILKGKRLKEKNFVKK